jgi:cell wall assembly regulator SMI1
MESSVIYNKCNKIIEELNKFDSSILELGIPIDDDRIRLFEKSIGFNLPVDFKYMLSIHNGISLSGTEVYGLDDNLRGASLNKIYHFEHFEAINPMPAHFMPFSPDGRGNHYCFDLSQSVNYLCPVIFWQWDFEYKDLGEVEQCYDHFMDWVQEVMIDWTLEDTNYDGSEK